MAEQSEEWLALILIEPTPDIDIRRHKMGYFNALTNSWFKKAENGRIIFYPYGRLGHGYIISIEDEFKIKRFLNRYNIISFTIIITSVILFGIYSFVLLIFFIPFYSIKINRTLLNAKKTEEKMKLGEALKNVSASMGIPTCIFIFILCLLMTGMSIFSIFISKLKLAGILGVLFFGLCLLHSTFLLYYSIKLKKKPY